MQKAQKEATSNGEEITRNPRWKVKTLVRPVEGARGATRGNSTRSQHFKKTKRKVRRHWKKIPVRKRAKESRQVEMYCGEKFLEAQKSLLGLELFKYSQKINKERYVNQGLREKGSITRTFFLTLSKKQQPREGGGVPKRTKLSGRKETAPAERDKKEWTTSQKKRE